MLRILLTHTLRTSSRTREALQVDSAQMSGEFSLLHHLGVSVEKSDAPARAAPTPAPSKDAFRVWAPAQHPPTNKAVPAERVRTVLAHNRKGPQKSYADPTGEVLVRHDHGTEVQYVVYNSKYPSVHGVNKQLAERKAAEKARESAAAASATAGLTFGEDEALQEKARRHILRELHACNRDQANRKKEEERRDRERRIAQEKEQLRYRDVEAMRSAEEAHVHRMHQEEAVRRAADEALAAKRRAAAAAAEAAENTYYSSAWNGADEDEQRRSAALRRTREFAEANRKMADRQRAEQEAAAAAERARAHAELTAAAQNHREEQTYEAQRHRRAAETLRAAQEAEREGWLTAASRAPPDPVGSLFDFADQREAAEAQRAQQRLREDMAVNAHLAEKKKAQAAEERERDRLHAAQVAEANFEAFQREMAQTRLRRQEERVELQKAAEVAAAQSREMQQREAHVDASRADDALLFWDREDSVRTAATKAVAQRRYYEDVRRQAERKAAERAAEERAERAREKVLVEYDGEVARAETAKERQEAQEKIAHLRRTLEAQMADKRRQRRHEEHGLEREVYRVPAPDVMSLYRCPVTHELFPASAYDFGVQKGR